MARKADEPDPASGKAWLSSPNSARRGETVEKNDPDMRNSDHPKGFQGHA